jgi:regulator of protease activity HflC (stomatin/prohibitin superfamily)
MNKSFLGIFVVVIIGLILFFASAFIVKETDKVVITQFGEVVRLVDEPGLSFKMPVVQDIKRLDKRWLEWDGDPNQITTLDKRYIYIDVFARWRISDPMVFIETLRDETSAQGRLDDIIDNATRNVVANHKLIEVIRSTNRDFEHDADEAALSLREDELLADQREKVEPRPAQEPEPAEGQEAPEGQEASDGTTSPESESGEAPPAGAEEPEPETAESDTAADGKEEAPADAEAAEPQKDSEEEAREASAEADKHASPRKSDQRRNLYSTELGRDKLTRLGLEKASAKASQLGIEIKDVQIKRIDYIESVQAKVFDRMISERKRVAESYRSEGQGRSAEIIGKMEMEMQEIQSEAYRESQKIMGRADAIAAETYAKAYKKNPEFYRFTKTMESYRQTVDESSWLILSTEADYVRHLKTMKGKAP